MRIVYVYDLEDWALHNVGRSLKSMMEAAGHEWVMIRAEEYYRAPVACDVLYLSFSFLFRNGFPYREHARELICTIHDPFEISNFIDRRDWARLPLRPVSPQVFDRVSAISREMHDLLQANFSCRRLYHTPTYPHDAPAIEAARAGHGVRSGNAIRFFSATNAPARYSWKEVAGRFRYLRSYLYDHERRISGRQLTSILARTHRKNIPWLVQLERRLARRQLALTDFRYGRRAPVARDSYLTDLAASDVYVCTSYMEGGPLPVMEAVIAGLAVLSTPVGQVEDWVTHGENGYICESVAEFAARADAYLEDPELLRAHQRRSLEVAANRSLDAGAWRRFLDGA